MSSWEANLQVASVLIIHVILLRSDLSDSFSANTLKAIIGYDTA